MNSPMSNLGRGFETLLRDIERWKERTSDARVGAGTTHDLIIEITTHESPRATKVHTLILGTSATIIAYRSLQDEPGEIAGMWLF